MYDTHPSTLLRNTFLKKAFQGVPPEKAIYLFLGLDANYSEAIEQSPIFRDLLEYHEDGPAFWRKHGVHHPFLLPGYRGDGHRYHRTFAGIGFRPEHAALVSFVEILNVPTFGRNNLTVADLDRRHLAHLNRTILEGEAKHIFIPGCVAKLMRASGCFPWLPVEPKDEGLPLKVWFRSGEKTIYWHYHLSVYGAHKAKQEAQLRQISTLITAGGGDHTKSAITTCASVRVEGLLQSEDIKGLHKGLTSFLYRLSSRLP